MWRDDGLWIEAMIGLAMVVGLWWAVLALP